MKVVSAVVLITLGYLCFDARAYLVSERVENGYDPVALAGALLALGAALWLLLSLARPYLRWSERLSLQRRYALLGAWLLAAGGTAAWTVAAFLHYRHTMPMWGGSFLRFYFTPLPLWACVAAFLAAGLTVYSLHLSKEAANLLAGLALIGLGYLCLDARAYRAADRMSNGYHPVALFGALLELGAALWLLRRVWAPYVAWAGRLSPRNRYYILGAWLLATGAATVWTVIAFQRYTAGMPEKLGSYFRFYFTPLPLWACLATWLGTLPALRSLRRC